MSVFLRWGVFGILGVAALLYAYNASKRLAETRVTTAPVAEKTPAATEEETEDPETSAQAPDETVQGPGTQPEAEAPRKTSAECEAELVVAQRALDMRKEGAPLDRVLRIQEIAWQESSERRERLTAVATRWYNYSGNFSPEALRIAVTNACEQATAAS